MKRAKRNIKSKRNKVTIFIILTKLILCIAVVSIAFIISINQKVKEVTSLCTKLGKY